MDGLTRKRLESLQADFAAGLLPEQEGRKPHYRYCPDCRTANGNVIRDPITKLPLFKSCGTCNNRGLVRDLGQGKVGRL